MLFVAEQTLRLEVELWKMSFSLWGDFFYVLLYTNNHKSLIMDATMLSKYNICQVANTFRFIRLVTLFIYLVSKAFLYNCNMWATSKTFTTYKTMSSLVNPAPMTRNRISCYQTVHWGCIDKKKIIARWSGTDTGYRQKKPNKMIWKINKKRSIFHNLLLIENIIKPVNMVADSPDFHAF